MLHKEKRLQIFQIALPIILLISPIPFTPAINVGAEHVVPIYKLDPVLKPFVLSSILSSRAPTTSRVPIPMIRSHKPQALEKLEQKEYEVSDPVQALEKLEQRGNTGASAPVMEISVNKRVIFPANYNTEGVRAYCHTFLQC